MTFCIRFLNELDLNYELVEKATYACISIRDFQEQFLTPLDYWNRMDYECHWRSSLSSILDSSLPTCLITAISNPEQSNFINWWLLYPVGVEIYLRNHILFLADLRESFDPYNPSQFIPKREVFNEDGELISEWSVSFDEIRSFLSLNP